MSEELRALIEATQALQAAQEAIQELKALLLAAIAVLGSVVVSLFWLLQKGNRQANRELMESNKAMRAVIELHGDQN